MSLQHASLLLVALASVGAAEAEAGLAARHPGDAGIAADPAVIFATGFEDGIREPLRIERKGVEVAREGGLPFAGAACAQITATKEVDEGGDIGLRWKDGVDTCFMRVYVRFAKDTLMPHHFINISAMNDSHKYRWGGGAGIRPEGGRDGRVSTTLEPPKDEGGKWHFYSYWHEMHSWQTLGGEADGRPNAYYGNVFSMEASPPLERERWICLEMMLKLNTPGQADGEQAFWIDGRRIGHWRPGSPEGTWIRENFATWGEYNKRPQPFAGYSWRTDAALRINGIKLQWYLSSDQSWKKMTSARNTVWFDNLVVARSYIGPLAPR